MSANSDKEATLDEQIEFYHQQYEQTHDHEESIEKTVKKYKNLELAGQDTSIQAQSIFGLNFGNDSIVYNNDSNQYVYMGSWEWDEFDVGDPYDHIGVTTENTTDMPITEVIFNGYDSQGDKNAHMNSEISSSRYGSVQLAAESAGGVSFWIDERDIRSGSMSAYLGGLSTSTTDEVRIEYDHATTTTDITGIGGSVDVKSGGGFNISWENGVDSTSAISAGADYGDL
ncbi:hypothetical protein [Halobacillus sp. A5]|uniref:hypothetical protein n=1 Tax=Halobacillus sp. A5 TaxID=2880263 RepID=UPI0020A67159|nr:hypothetical protein [Halobacillus sp. A5]MCP3029018.1 hypothetical protein [Halobacillus sp. A5]